MLRCSLIIPVSMSSKDTKGVVPVPDGVKAKSSTFSNSQDVVLMILTGSYHGVGAVCDGFVVVLFASAWFDGRIVAAAGSGGRNGSRKNLRTDTKNDKKKERVLSRVFKRVIGE
eukprot:scaffold9816_cov99-Skeletonema_dohrnii-CCMP3373.AAC.5